MIFTILALVLVAYLPGALLFRLPTADRPQRAALKVQERVFWAVLLSVTWSVTLVMALAAFGAYSLPRLLWTNGALSAVIVAIAPGRLSYSRTAATPTLTMLVPAAFVALGAWLYFPSAEYLIGGKDPGVYINQGIQIAKHGDLLIHDPVIAAIPDPARSLFLRPVTPTEPYSVRFMGYFVRDPGAGEVMAQFPPWFGASIAIGYDLGGITGARATTGVWALLGLLAVYFAGMRLFGCVAAAMATTLLAIHVLQVWFARYPNAELASQPLLFAALLAFRHTRDGSRTFFGAVAGLLAGLQLFARFDGLLSVGALAGAAVLAVAMRERVGRAFVATLATSTVVGVWYLVGPMWHYSATYVGTVHYGGGWWMLGTLAIAAAMFVALARRESVNVLVRRWVPPLLATAIVGLAIYAYFFRQPGDPTAAGSVGNAYALRNFRWYVTEIGLFAAIVGFAALLWRRFWQDPAFYLTVAIYAGLTFYKPRIVPEHFWAGRRFLTVILPAVMLSLAALARWLLPRSFSRPVRLTAATLPLIGVAALGVVFWRQAAPVRAHVEYAGLEREIQRRLVTAVGPRDLVIVESRRADSDLHVLALPLAYIYDRQVLVLDAWNPDKRALEVFVEWARTRYANVYFLGGGGTDLLSRRIDGELVAASRIRVPEYASTLNTYPEGVRSKEFDLGLYRLVRPEFSSPPSPDLTIGGQDDLSVARFFAKERRADGSTFRWTKNRSFVMLRGVTEDAREVVIWMSSGGRAAQAAPATVKVMIGDRVIGEATPVDELRPYAFPLPPETVLTAVKSGNPFQVRLDVATWNPRGLLNLPDTRDLGVLVTRVQVR